MSCNVYLSKKKNGSTGKKSEKELQHRKALFSHYRPRDILRKNSYFTHLKVIYSYTRDYINLKFESEILSHGLKVATNRPVIPSLLITCANI